MSEPRDAWREVAGKAEALGLKLKLHLEQEHDTSAGSSSAEDAAEDAADAKAVIDDMGRKVQEVFDSIGHAAKDPAVHEDVKDVGRLIVDALSSTFSAVGAEVNTRTSEGQSSGPIDVDGLDSTEEVPGDESEGGDS